MKKTGNNNAQLDTDTKGKMRRDDSDDGAALIEDSTDPFYSESNIRYLDSIMQDMKDGKVHFAEHELM